MFDWLVPEKWAYHLEFPLEVQKKARYLLITCFIILVGLTCVTIVHFIFQASLLMVIGDGVCYITLGMTLKCIKDRKIEMAANFLIGGLLLSLFLQKVMGDVLVEIPENHLRLYETLSILILFLLFWGLFALRDRQLNIYMVLAVSVLIAHFVVLVNRKYAGVSISAEAWRTFLIALIILLTSGFIAKMVLGLSYELIDLTKEKSEIIRRQNEELEQKVAKRTQELVSINDDLKQFAYIASHDLKEPLRTIASFLGLIKVRMKSQIETDKDLATYIDFAVDGASRLNRLINDLLSYSRINAQTSGFTQVDLNTVLQSVLIQLNTFIKENEAIVTAERLPHALGDRYLIGQVLQNLIENAVKYKSPHLVPSIYISSKMYIDKVEIRIQDNGVGIPEEYAQQVFQIFQVLSSEKSANSTGIGLAICKKIIEQHNGTIWVEANEGNGSVFCFTLSKHTN